MDYDKIKDTDTRLKMLLIDRGKTKGFLAKFKKTATVYNAWKEIAPILKDIAVERHNGNMEKAENLFKVVYIKFENSASIKRALNVSEIQEVLGKKDFLEKFTKKMVLAESILDKANKYIEKGTTLCNIGNSLYALYVGRSYTYRSELSRATKLRLKMQQGQRQMMHVMSIAAELASFAPPGIKEYLEYNMAAFAACGKTFDRVNKYAANIEKLSNEVERLWLKVGREKNSIDNTRMNLGNNTRRKGAEYTVLSHKAYKK